MRHTYNTVHKRVLAPDQALTQVLLLPYNAYSPYPPEFYACKMTSLGCISGYFCRELGQPDGYTVSRFQGLCMRAVCMHIHMYMCVCVYAYMHVLE